MHFNIYIYGLYYTSTRQTERQATMPNLNFHSETKSLNTYRKRKVRGLRMNSNYSFLEVHKAWFLCSEAYGGMDNCKYLPNDSLGELLLQIPEKKLGDVENIFS